MSLTVEELINLSNAQLEQWADRYWKSQTLEYEKALKESGFQLGDDVILERNWLTGELKFRAMTKEEIERRTQETYASQLPEGWGAD